MTDTQTTLRESTLDAQDQADTSLTEAENEQSDHSGSGDTEDVSQGESTAARTDTLPEGVTPEKVIKLFEQSDLFVVSPTTVTQHEDRTKLSADPATSVYTSHVCTTNSGDSNVAETGIPSGNYAVQQFEVNVRQTLEAQDVTASVETKVASPNCPVTNSYHFGGVSVINALSWALELLSVPYLDPTRAEQPIARQIPCEHIKIVVPDKALQYLSVDESLLSELSTQFSDIPANEIQPRERHLRRAAYRQRPYASYNSTDDLSCYLEAIKSTVKHRFAFRKRYGSTGETVDIHYDTVEAVPSPDPFFENWTLEELHDELWATRRVRSQVEPYLTWLETHISSIQPTYRELVRTHFSAYADQLISDDDDQAHSQRPLPGTEGVPSFSPTDYPQSFYR